MNRFQSVPYLVKSLKALIPIFLLLFLVTACASQPDDTPEPITQEDPTTEPDPDPEPLTPQVTSILEATATHTPMPSTAFNGTYIGGCSRKSNGHWSNGVLQCDNYSDTISVSASLSNTVPLVITINGGTYDWVSGTNPATEEIVYTNGAHFPRKYRFTDNGYNLTSGWGASSPGGWATESCQYTRQ